MSKKTTKETLRSSSVDTVDNVDTLDNVESLTTEESISHEEFEKKYLDLEELLLRLVCLRKFKRATEDWVRDTNELIKDKIGTRQYRPEACQFIEEYLQDLRIFAVKIMELVRSMLNKCDL